MKKEIHFAVPKELYEDFHRLFPRRGEKTDFLVQVIERATRRAGAKAKFVDEILEEIEDED